MDNRIESEIAEIEEISTRKTTWLKNQADRCMITFWVLTVILGISSTSLPFFAFLATDGGKTWLVPMLSVVVAFCSFMLQIFNFHMLWRSYRYSEFSMKRLQQTTLHSLKMLKETDWESYKTVFSDFYAKYERIEDGETIFFFNTLKPITDVSSGKKLTHNEIIQPTGEAGD